MYILYNLITYATGACLGSHSIGWPTLSNTPSQTATSMLNTNPEGFDSFRVFLCPSGWHLRGGPRSGVWPSSVPLFGFCACSSGRSRCRRSSSGRRSRLLSACSAVRSSAPARRVGIVCASFALSAPYTIHAPALLRSSGCPALPRTVCACSTLPVYANDETGTGIATVLRSVFGRLPSSAPLLLSRSAHATQTLRKCSACLRYPGSQEQRQRQWQRKMLREKERANLPCPVVRGQYMYGVRHKKSILGNEKSEIGNRKTF